MSLEYEPASEPEKVHNPSTLKLKSYTRHPTPDTLHPEP